MLNREIILQPNKATFHYITITILKEHIVYDRHTPRAQSYNCTLVPAKTTFLRILLGVKVLIKETEG